MGHAGESLLESIERIIRSVLRGLSDDAVFECLQKREEMEPQSRVLADSKVVADLDGVLAAKETKSSANRPAKLPRTKSWLDKVETHVREVKCKKIDGPAPLVVGRDFSDIKLEGRASAVLVGEVAGRKKGKRGDGWMFIGHCLWIPTVRGCTLHKFCLVKGCPF